MVNEVLIKELESSFKCVRCGVCCTNDFLRIVTGEEAKELHKRLESKNWLRGFVHFYPLLSVPGCYLLNKGDPCPFYDAITRECLVYDLRPECCRKFPVRSLSEGRGSLECSMSCVGFFAACANVLDVPAYCKEVK